MPLSFHILTSREGIANPPRGPKANSFMSIIRGNQDIMGMFILGGVFERHPKLKIACVEEIAFHEVGQIDAIVDIAGAALGLYLMGMQFLRRRKSALIDGAGDDARELSAHLAAYLDGGQVQLARARSPAADSLATLGF